MCRGWNRPRQKLRRGEPVGLAVAVGYIGLAASQATAAPSSHHSDDLFPADDAHSHFHECNRNQWCCAWYVTGAFAEWGRAGA